MKNKKGVMIALAVMLVLVGVISAMSVKVAAGRTGESKIVFAFGGNVELRNTMEIPLSEVSELDVAYGSQTIKVYPTEGDTIVIKEYLSDAHKDGLATVNYENVSGGKRAVVKGKQENVITIIGVQGVNERIEIYLPKTGLDSLHLQVGSGSIATQDAFAWETRDLQVSAGSGSIKWRDTKADIARFSAGSGSIRLTGITADLQVSTSSGSIKMEDIKGDMTLAAGSGSVRVSDAEGVVNVASGSGSITIEELAGGGSFAAGSGSIRVTMAQVTKDIGIGAGSGSVYLTVPKDLSFAFEGKTGSGGIYTYFEEVLSYNKNGNEASGVVGENPSCKISVETKSGKIDIAAK